MASIIHSDSDWKQSETEYTNFYLSIIILILNIIFLE